MSINTYQKHVNLLFIAAGGLAWFISNHYLGVLFGNVQARGMMSPGVKDILGPALPVVVGAVTFIALRRNARAYSFSSDSISELTKMTWPTPKDTQLGTIVVIIAVLLAAIFFFGVDFSFNKLIRVLIES